MIKIDIISGFLGAGKTTFIKMMLKHYMNKGEKCVYVVNEFGQQGIDGILMENENCSVYELANGCICCSLRTDFVVVLKDIVEQIKPDRIIFEPSGVFVFADFFSFLNQQTFAGKCEIGHRISIVDAVTFPKIYRSASYFIQNQTRNSSLVILSKTQMENANTEETICDIKNINPNIAVVNVNWDELNDEAFEEILKPVPFVPVKINLRDSDNKVIRKITGAKKERHAKYETLSFDADKFNCFDDAEDFTKSIINKKYGDVIRGKGFVNIAGDTYLINIVGDTYDITQHKYDEESLFTIIGTELKKGDDNA